MFLTGQPSDIWYNNKCQRRGSGLVTASSNSQHFLFILCETGCRCWKQMLIHTHLISSTTIWTLLYWTVCLSSSWRWRDSTFLNYALHLCVLRSDANGFTGGIDGHHEVTHRRSQTGKRNGEEEKRGNLRRKKKLRGLKERTFVWGMLMLHVRETESVYVRRIQCIL